MATRTVTFKGSPVTLVGRVLKTGAEAPDFRLISGGMKEARLGDFKGKVKVITSFPSLDTPVCDLQVKEFNKRAAGLSGDAVIIGVSKDLPFAQKRFCESFDIKDITVLSDYKSSSFGINYGLLIKELGLLARAVIIVDKNDTVRYLQIVPELATPPDYRAALTELDLILKSTPSGDGVMLGEGLPAHCKPCGGGTPPLPREKADKLAAAYKGWQLVEEKKIVKEFIFKDFIEAKYFLDLISVIAEEEGHHPSMTLAYNKLKVTLTTHAAGGLTENDFIMAGHINSLEEND